MLTVLLCFALVSRAAFSMTLPEAVQTSWHNSSMLAGQRDQVDLSAGDRWRRFIPNEPQFQFANTDDTTGQSFGISETLPLPFKTLASTKLDSAKEKMQRAELFAKRYELARSTVQAFIDCATSRKAIGMQNQFVDDNETLARVMRAKYEAGTATQAENIAIELQIRQLHADLATARDRAVSACKKLGWLLGSDTPPETAELGPDLDQEILAELGELTPDENRAKSASLVADANYTMAWWSQLPDITLSVTKNHYLFLPGSPSGKPDTWSYGISFTVPLLFPFRETVEAARARSQATVDRGAAELQLISARADKLDAAREYSRSRKRLEELRARDLALAEALMESSLSAYRSGKLGFAEITLARKTLSDLRAQELTLRGAIISAHLRCLNDCNDGKGAGAGT